MIKTFRNKLADGSSVPGSGMEKIRLSTRDGMTGYKIKKFQLMPYDLNANQEACVKIFRVKQDAAVFDFDFSDSQLIAAAYYTNSSAADTYSEDLTVIFDNVVFNQDIFITHQNNNSGIAVNYYLELEQVKLDLSEATVATLKDMRGSS